MYKASVAALPPAQQAIARRIFVRLVHFGEGRADTRRQQTLGQLRSALDAPGVLEAAVIPVPDDMMGEKVGAVIVAGPEFELDAVIGHVRERIADFKVPQYMSITDDLLPRNPGGKVLKGPLRKEAEWGAQIR